MFFQAPSYRLNQYYIMTKLNISIKVIGLNLRREDTFGTNSIRNRDIHVVNVPPFNKYYR